MPNLFLIQTILLIASASGVFFWITTPALVPFTLQLVAVLILLYFGAHAMRKHYPRLFHRSSITLDITILTSMILLLVTDTGVLSSPFFFLCYFLLFGVAMLYEIEATLVLTGVFILFFLFLPGTTLSGIEGVTQLTQIISLVMITPLAIFTGHQYETSLEEQRLRENLNKQIGKEQSDILLFLSLNLKKTLASAIDTLSITIPKEKAKEVRTGLQTLYEDLKNLYRSADELQNTIDREDQ